MNYNDPNRILSAIEEIETIINIQSDAYEVLDQILKKVLELFSCDRAWLLYPCNPNLPTFEVLYERTTPSFPGAKALNEPVPMTRDMANYCNRALSNIGYPEIDPPSGQEMNNDIALKFDVRSIIFMALKPQNDDAWMFGMHHCAIEHNWTDDEMYLFKTIGQRITKSIENLIFIKQVTESEQKYRHLFENASDAIYLISENGKIIDANQGACTCLDREKDEILHLYINDVDPNFSVAEFLSFWERVPFNIPKQFESTHKTKNDDLIPVEVIGQKFRIDNATCFYGVARNSTKRQKAEKALKESEERFRNLMENIDAVAVQGYGPDGTTQYWNKASERLYGYSQQEAIGRNLLDLIIPSEMKVAVAKEMHGMAESGQPIPSGELLLTHKDGSRIPVISHHTIVRVPGREQELFCLDVDITERKQVEGQLRESENELRLTLDATTNGIWKWNLTNNEWFFSPRYYAMLGYEPGEFPASFESWSNLIHPDDLGPALRNAENYLNSFQDEYHSEFRLKTKGGNYRWMHSHGRIVKRDKHGKALRIIGRHQDITEQKQAEKDLSMAHEKLLTILDSIDSTVYVADLDTHEILFMNKKMIIDFGGDKTGDICYRVFRKNSEPCQCCTNDQLLDKHGNPADVCIWHDKNPVTSRYYINYDRAIEWTDGRLVRIQIATDITDLKNMEAQLTQAQKMEAIGTLAGGIAHDFNNILFPIIGHSEILMDDFPKDSPIQDSLKEIFASAMRAKDLVNQILSFARQEKNELKMMRMHPIIKEALKLIRSTIPTTIDISQNIRPDCGAVKADPTLIHQIVMNLTTNAWHAMAETGGELSVGLKQIELGEYDRPNSDMSPGLYACLTVADTGTGMDQKLIHRIFDPFFTTKEKGRGTGMGLSVVHGIVKNMNGAIQVYSKPGKGSEFHVYFPVVETFSQAQKIETGKPIPGGMERILLVDDEAAIIALEEVSLSRLGYQVTTCTSSTKALEIFRSDPNQFDLVITDMAMPKIPGDRLAEELIKIRPGIPILLCTGFSDRLTDVKINSPGGIRDLLFKPLVIKDFAEKIREVLDNTPDGTNV